MTQSLSVLLKNDTRTNDIDSIISSNLTSTIDSSASGNITYDADPLAIGDVTSAPAASASDNLAFDDGTNGNATFIASGYTPDADYTTTPGILSGIAETMSHDSASTPPVHAATTVLQNGSKVAIVTDMQLHFIVVGCLFIIVVILALINLYIHFRSGGRGLMAVKIVGNERVPRRGGYTVKMTAKPNLFI